MVTTHDPSSPISTTPSVSVVMPNFNHAHVLPKAIEAHARQSRPPLEIIVVDDCSTDDSVAVIERLHATHPTLRLVRRAVNGGPNAAINTGLAEAQGDLVTFSAADDLVDFRFHERSAEALAAYPQAGLSFMDPSRLYLEPERWERVPLALAETMTFFPPERFAALFKRNSFTISSNGVVYRRAFIQAAGGFRADLDWQSDWIANLLLSFRHGAVYVPEVWAHSVAYPQSYGSKGVRSAAGQRRLTLKCLEAIATDYADVAPLFRSAALLPEMRLRALAWLCQTPEARSFITPRLVYRLLQREAWSAMRPLLPQTARRWMRRRVGRSVGQQQP